MLKQTSIRADQGEVVHIIQATMVASAQILVSG